MSSLQGALLTVGLGLIVFPLQQIYLKVYLEPLQELRKIIVKIGRYLGTHQVAPVDFQEVGAFRKEVDDLVYELQANLTIANGYPLFQLLKLLPPKDLLIRASYDLHEMTNIVGNFQHLPAHNWETQREPLERYSQHIGAILKKLGIRDLGVPQG